MTVELSVVPHEQQHLVVIGTTVRKAPNIVAAWLRSLAWQVCPKNVQRFYLFIDDQSGPETRALLDAFVKDHGGLVWDAEGAPAGDFSDLGETHQWGLSAMQRAGRSKDRILQFARENRAEAVWLCDSDLICDPMTFASLWSIPEQIVCGVYWTRWNKVPPGSPPLHAGPQVWQSHPYGLAGNGLEEWELRQKLIERQIVHVYGQGACTLIRRDALMRGVSFSPVPGNNGPGLMQGEDRQFCIRAELLHIRMVADGWPDIFHVYHRPEDELLIPEMERRLTAQWVGEQEEADATGRWRAPRLGDLVSLELQALEPVPTDRGWVHPPTQFVRGRLGQMKLHPELEEAIAGMTRSHDRVVPVHFPLSYDFPPYRGQRRLIRVTLIDHKPMGFPPVVEDEIIKNRTSAWIDTTTCTPELLGQMREVHADA